MGCHESIRGSVCGDDLLGEGFPEPLALGLQESEVVVEMLAISLNVSAQGNDAGPIVSPLAGESVVGQ
jgi:hypothetical protein